MTFRNLEARLVKLERRTKHADEILLIWSRPSESDAIAVKRHLHLFDPLDRVVLARWYDEEDPPVPAWHRNFPKHLSDREFEASYRMVRDAAEVAERLPEHSSDFKLIGLSDADLWYKLLRIDPPSFPVGSNY